MIPTDLRPLIHQGDVLERLRQLPEGVFQVCVTSPPYWRMRDYGVEGQDGLEDTVEAFVARQVAVFREVRRVLRKDGTAWVNIGDTYVGGGARQEREELHDPERPRVLGDRGASTHPVEGGDLDVG